MIDYNFFENYEVKKVKKSPSIKIAMVLYALILLAVAAFIGRNYMMIAEKETQIDELTVELLQLKSDDSIARILDKQGLERDLNSIVEKLDDAHDALMTNGSVNENMIAILVDAMPMDVALSGFSIANNHISAIGSAGSKPAIAEFEYNLRQMSVVEDVLIGGIERDEETFSFDISITLRKGGVSNEN